MVARPASGCPSPTSKATHDLEITAELTATLNVPLPPMLRTTHHPARTDVHRRTVSLSCGQCSSSRTVTIRVYHPEHVRAVENRRAPVTRTRQETLTLAPVSGTGQARALGVGADDPYVGLHVPPPTPEPPRAEQTTAGDSSSWNWPW